MTRQDETMRVVTITDNGFAAEAIRRTFGTASGVHVVGSVDGRHECGAAVAEAQPDVVIVDEMTRSSSAVTRVAEIRAAVPAAKIVALSSQPGAAWVADAAHAGAHAAIAKTVKPGVLALLVREIGAGTVHHAFEGPRAASRRDAGHTELSARELEILRLVAGGNSNRRIAQELRVTEQTVKFHLSNVYRKLGVANRTAASRHVHVHGLIGGPGSPAQEDAAIAA